jgi:hypothetical protein
MFAGAAARPVMAKGMGMSPTMMLARRWNTQENKGGRAKLVCHRELIGLLCLAEEGHWGMVR